MSVFLHRSSSARNRCHIFFLGPSAESSIVCGFEDFCVFCKAWMLEEEEVQQLFSVHQGEEVLASDLM